MPWWQPCWALSTREESELTPISTGPVPVGKGAFLTIHCFLGSLNWNKHLKILMVVDTHFQPRLLSHCQPR